MPIANWTPTPDFAVVPDHRSKRQKMSHDESNGHSGKSNGNGVRATARDNGFIWPDKMFMCTGRGKEGTVAELWYGLEARIGVITSLDDVLIREMWALPDVTNDRMVFLLLSCNDNSILLHFNADGDIIPEIYDNETWLNLSSETLLAQEIGNYLIQVTGAEFRISSFLILSPEEYVFSHVSQLLS